MFAPLSVGPRLQAHLGWVADDRCVPDVHLHEEVEIIQRPLVAEADSRWAPFLSIRRSARARQFNRCFYATIIDSTKAHCATSGNLVLDVEGEIDASTTACPDVPLFKAGACDESASGRI